MDRQGGSYRQPKASDDPLLTVLAREEKAKGLASAEALRQEREMQEALNDSEGIKSEGKKTE